MSDLLVSFDLADQSVKEDSWLCSIVATHRLFCGCGDYKEHLLRLLCPATTGEDGGPGDAGLAAGDSIADEDILAGLDGGIIEDAVPVTAATADEPR